MLPLAVWAGGVRSRGALFAATVDEAEDGPSVSFGSALFEAKAYDRAIEELTRLTAMPGYNSPEGFVSLGAAQVTAKHYKEAIPPLEKAIALAPTNAQAEAYLAWSYFGLKDATNFKLHGAKARTLGYNEPTLLAYLGRIEKGEAIK